MREDAFPEKLEKHCQAVEKQTGLQKFVAEQNSWESEASEEKCN